MSLPQTVRVSKLSCTPDTSSLLWLGILRDGAVRPLLCFGYKVPERLLRCSPQVIT